MRNAILALAVISAYALPSEKVVQPIEKVFREFSDSYYKRFPKNNETWSREQKDQEFYEKLDRRYHWDWPGMTDIQKRGQVFRDKWRRKSLAQGIRKHGSEKAYLNHRAKNQRRGARD